MTVEELEEDFDTKKTIGCVNVFLASTSAWYFLIR